MVLKALKKARPDQRCFRLVADTLVERTVGEVLPAVEQNREKLLKIINEYNTKMVDKGKELNKFKDEHGILLKDDTVRLEKPTPQSVLLGKN